MNPRKTTAIAFLKRLEALGAPAVITKNKSPDKEKNFRIDERNPERWLNGKWTGPPAKVDPGMGFGIHFVVHKNCVWIGKYQKALEEAGTDQGVLKKVGKDQGKLKKVKARYSLVLSEVQYFEVTDLKEAGEPQRKLLAILRQNGAVTYSYYAPEKIDVEGANRPTQRQALVDARLGQGRYRRDLLALWEGRCAVTGTGQQAVIVASHAMPWQDANDKQKLDPCNGLPLIATLDKLFDAGLIAFDPATGDMQVSPTLSDHDRTLMTVPAPLRKKPTNAQALYLQYHLEKIFRRQPQADN